MRTKIRNSGLAITDFGSIRGDMPIANQFFLVSAEQELVEMREQ